MLIEDGRHRLRGRGWETDGGDLWEVLDRLDSEGCSRYVVTDVTKDGTLEGPNLDLLGGVADRTDAPVIASGGAGELSHLADALHAGADAALAASIFHFGRFSIPQTKRYLAEAGLAVRPPA